MKTELVNNLRNFYARWERPISSLSLIGGFVFDAVTLRRVDMFWENFWVAAHLIIVGTFIMLVNSKGNMVGDEENPSKANFWYVNILQFFFGGLLSTYLVFYFRSADLATSWLFILILALAFWANESLKRQYARLSFQITLFFLSLFSFAIFILPVVFHSLGSLMFVLSGIVSLLLILLYAGLIKFWNRERFEEGKKLMTLSIGAVFLIMNILYFTDIIPPIPLSLQDAGIYHSIQKENGGNYTASYEAGGRLRALRLYDDMHIAPGGTLYAYSAVFSPTSLNTNIIHRWQSFDTGRGRWIDREKVELPLVGGRESGYRTYSLKNNLTAGRWRVNVETLSGQVLGRIRFNVIISGSPVPLNYKTLE